MKIQEFFLLFGTFHFVQSSSRDANVSSRYKQSVCTASEDDETTGIYVTYNELQNLIDRFSMQNVQSYREILFDPTNFQVIIGARDYLFRLSLVGLQLLESAEWSSTENDFNTCINKGQRQEDCHNYVRVLQTIDNGKLFVCGTNSFSPVCTWRRLNNINRIESTEMGIGKSPFNPRHSITSLMTADQSFFAGTTLDFLGKDGAFMRSQGRNLGYLRTRKSNMKWLSQPEFVDSFESGGFVYFFFKENAIEAMNCGKTIYSRIGRICKNDSGGSTVLKNIWTTFLKSRLNCSRPGNYPSYYDNLQSVAYLPNEQIFYGLFTTHENSLSGSAVCAFSMSSVNASFDGAFKHQPSPHSAWGPVRVGATDHFRCQNSSNRVDKGFLADKYQLMDSATQSFTQDPLILQDFQRLTHIAVDVVSTRQSGSVHVSFIATAEGLIQMWSMLSLSMFMPSSSHSQKTPKTCLLETIEIFPAKTRDKIISMKFLKDTNSLYVGTENEVLRIPIARCDRYKTRHQCLAARDPYCGWDTNILQCTRAPNNDPMNSSWIQHVIGCPLNNGPVDGKWSSWSVWQKCKQHGKEDDCMCRYRKCDAPRPKRGGNSCVGDKTEVTNCTVHGDWTDWSSWSECSASCGIAVKTRKRSCTNPEPQNGGRVCVGQETNEIYCHSLPPCPKYTELPVDGSWSSWGSWSMCSASCGRGTKRRQRTCNEPSPNHGGKFCPGCNNQVEECVGKRCSSVDVYSDWTPWLDVETTTFDMIQRRFKVECSAEMGRKGIIRVQADSPVHEDRRCNPLGEKCSVPYGSKRQRGGWTSWSEWSPCDQPCGGGIQVRTRECKGSCQGPPKEERQCNIFQCSGTWSCWSDWTTCTSSCGTGVQERNRQCVTVHDPLIGAQGCIGVSNQTQKCQTQACTGEEGWGSWSDWSPCDKKIAERIRTRRCLSNQPSKCRGLDLQKFSCDIAADSPAFAETRLYSESMEAGQADCASVQTIIGSCIACLVLGVVLGAVGVYSLCLKKSTRDVPSSPHYISAKPNHYVSVPKDDYKGRRGSGKSGRSSNKGDKGSCIELETLNSPTLSLKNGLNSIRSAVLGTTTLPTQDFFDTATMKRSSHGSGYGNGHIRADLDSDRIFFS